jgi:hypothetical protein
MGASDYFADPLMTQIIVASMRSQRKALVVMVAQRR